MTHGLADDRPCATGSVLCCPQKTRRRVNVGGWGVSDPPFCAGRLRPGSLTRGSLTPKVSARRSRRCLRRCFPRSVDVTAGTRTTRDRSTFGLRAANNADAVAITSFSIKRCSAPCNARRVAPPTRVVRAWPSGLDSASAPLAVRPLRDGHWGLSLDGVRTSRMSGIARVTRS
jgi:hypothetical protein